MRDAGLQAERTALAWSRTVLAVLANALILMRAGLAHESHSLTTFSVLLLATAAATYAFSRRRRAALVAGRSPVAPPSRALIGVAAISAAASLGGTLVIAATLRGTMAHGIDAEITPVTIVRRKSDPPLVAPHEHPRETTPALHRIEAAACGA